MRAGIIASVVLTLTLGQAAGQVYSPRTIKRGQPDASDPGSLANGIYAQAGAHTEREKAEAIWRFFLTDGRFVKPGMIYHIAGWAYEEPQGEVLDPVRLLNSYGFGLCYHIAPLLESIFKAGGFADARVWFLTGHTVAEVFYDGGYHYFDSDMMGYNPIGTSGPLKERPVASVHQIERDGSIITGKLAGPKQADPANVDYPWYPADVRAHAIGGLADLFTTKQDNWLYPFQRSQLGHTMDFTLRPGEKLIRFYHPEPEGLAYLPYRFDGEKWSEFPVELSEYSIRTSDGPRSQKDSRRWSTGQRQYNPPDLTGDSAIYEMPSPYVVIDAEFQMEVNLPGAAGRITVETSVDAGRTWTPAGVVTGPRQGSWTARPATLTRSEHGTRNAVSGSYGYLVRIQREGGRVGKLSLTTRFQLNPRTLPALAGGENVLEYASSGERRWELPVSVAVLGRAGARMKNAAPVSSGGQSYLANRGTADGEAVVEVSAPDGGPISGFDAGGRFLDLRDGLAPDKFTAEVRKVTPWPAAGAEQAASLAWSLSPDGPFTALWTYERQLHWKDGEVIDRTLRWPEVDRQVRGLPAGTRRVFVRYQIKGMGLDALRLSAVRTGLRPASPLLITHVWNEDGAPRKRTERFSAGQMRGEYRIRIPERAAVSNEALIFECPPGRQ